MGSVRIYILPSVFAFNRFLNQYLIDCNKWWYSEVRNLFHIIRDILTSTSTNKLSHVCSFFVNMILVFLTGVSVLPDTLVKSFGHFVVTVEVSSQCVLTVNLSELTSTSPVGVVVDQRLRLMNV